MQDLNHASQMFAGNSHENLQGRMSVMSKKKSMKKKLAVAMSVVNALNAVAPMALPYVNVSRDASTTGGGKHLIREA